MVDVFAARRPAPLVPGSFLLGLAPQLRRDMLGASERVFATAGDVARVRLGLPGQRRVLHMVFHPDGAHRVLAGASANYRKDTIFYSEIRHYFGDGLLTSQDQLWQHQKRFLQPLFTNRRVAGYATEMAVAARDLAATWRQRPAGVVDLHGEMTGLTLRIVCRALFGDDVGAAQPTVKRAFGPLTSAMRRRVLSPVRLPRHWPAPVNRQGAGAQRLLYEVCDEIIGRRRPGDTRQDLVGLLLDARVDGVALSPAEIRDQVLVFLLAGHETTSTALTYTLLLLGRHPEVQDRVRAEAREVLGDRTPGAEDLPALAYTTQTIKEAMRLYPSAPVLGRRATDDDEICGYHVPAGSDVLISPWVIHRHPEFWAEPGRFDPDRFTPEREKTRHRYAWMPFGGGPRACIGQHFSMLESVIALAVLVREFEFAAQPGEPAYTTDVTLRPSRGVFSRVAAAR